MNVSIWIREVGRLTLFCPRERHEELLLSVCRERLLCLENVVERLIARSVARVHFRILSILSVRICKKKKKKESLKRKIIDEYQKRKKHSTTFRTL